MKNVLLVVASLALSGVALATPQDEKITIKSLKLLGSGCPIIDGEPTYEYEIDNESKPDKPKFLIDFDAFTADKSKRRGLAKCKIKVKFGVPEGFKLFVYRAAIYGDINLREGAKAIFRPKVTIDSVNNIPGQEPEKFEGPRNGSWYSKGEFEKKQDPRCSPGVVTVNYEAELRITKGLNTDSSISIESKVGEGENDPDQKGFEIGLRKEKC